MRYNLKPQGGRFPNRQVLRRTARNAAACGVARDAGAVRGIGKIFFWGGDVIRSTATTRVTTSVWVRYSCKAGA